MLNSEKVTPILPTTVDYPNGYFPDETPFECSQIPSHGFCTHYGNMLFYFWHSMNYSDGKDIIAEDGSILVSHDKVITIVDYYNNKFRSSTCNKPDDDMQCNV